MNKKERKEIAKKIAKAEKIISTSTDKDEIAKAKAQILKISSQIKDLEDLMSIDEMVQDLLDS